MNMIERGETNSEEKEQSRVTEKVEEGMIAGEEEMIGLIGK